MYAVTALYIVLRHAIGRWLAAHFGSPFLGMSRVRPLVSQSGTDRSPLTTLRSTFAKADCAEGSAFHQKVWMPSGPGADQLFAFFKAFLSLVSSMLSGPSEEVLPTLFLVSFSHSFTPGSSLLTLPTVPTIFVQKSLTTSMRELLWRLEHCHSSGTSFGYSKGGFVPGISCVQPIFALVGSRP